MPRPGSKTGGSVRIPSPPSQKTLDKYGLTVDDWLEVAKRQGYVCFICKKLPENGRLNTDHDHVKKWKKMPPDERKRHVRGLLCYFCNHYYVGRCFTVFKADNAAEYMREHERRLREFDE